MTLQTVTEKVVIRMLNAAALIYGDLPIERHGEPAEFRAVLDLAIGIIRARAAHRAAAEQHVKLKLVAGGARPRKQKGPAATAIAPDHGSIVSPERKIA
ncbi:hypothetical protein HHL25_02905 [Rhizobium sp. S-51]|uniref:Uncharacterized protein n=1 Tax=Rhizobium terricola TaxID=2728849 RepID=A0A7Y0ATA1_9HYPH|nr:hypothetical protein [Rhizobium terricola]NML73068.1 hypothetical protein [Rhizobium terricola]